MAIEDACVIDGVRFMSVYHHDGRFMRGAGTFAFCRRDADGGRTVFCLDAAQDISRVALPGHRAWAYAVTQGMNELLVVFGERLDATALPSLRYDLAIDERTPQEALAAA
ncbi:hypothetical protein [Caulobacter flavus]|uniref:hypothetical protein n=1 Tax=Caulobacter flavus TaxID=1679497 RepID=UPI001F0BB051|nr:hypothetical protein [Caulobacter flavus]